MILQDPQGTAASLIAEAGAWTWEPLERRCDRWVAEEICSLSEEAHKLISALRQGAWQTAAVQRSILALHLAPILAVHRRILYGSENRLWNLVGNAMGERWSRTQSAALGLDGEPFGETVRAALGLYGLAAVEAYGLFDTHQRGVVDHALKLASGAGF